MLEGGERADGHIPDPVAVEGSDDGLGIERRNVAAGVAHGCSAVARFRAIIALT